MVTRYLLFHIAPFEVLTPMSSVVAVRDDAGAGEGAACEALGRGRRMPAPVSVTDGCPLLHFRTGADEGRGASARRSTGPRSAGATR